MPSMTYDALPVSSSCYIHNHQDAFKLHIELDNFLRKSFDTLKHNYIEFSNVPSHVLHESPGIS